MVVRKTKEDRSARETQPVVLPVKQKESLSYMNSREFTYTSTENKLKMARSSELIWFSKDYTLIMYSASKIEKCLDLITRWSFDHLRGQRKNSQEIDWFIKLHRLESKGIIIACRLLDDNGDM